MAVLKSLSPKDRHSRQQKICSSFLMRMETESFLKLKPRLVLKDCQRMFYLAHGRATWKRSLMNWRTIKGKFLSKVRWNIGMKWNAYNLKLITFLLDLMKHAEKDCPYPDSDKWGCQQSTSPIKQPCGYTILIIFVHSIDSFNWKPLQIIFQNKLRKINPNNRLKPEGSEWQRPK